VGKGRLDPVDPRSTIRVKYRAEPARCQERGGGHKGSRGRQVVMPVKGTMTMGEDGGTVGRASRKKSPQDKKYRQTKKKKKKKISLLSG